MKSWHALLVGIFLIILVWIWQSPLSGSARDDADLAPDFALQTMDGKTFRLSSSNGKIRFINFWGTWCPPCLKEIPDFIEIQNQYAETVQFVGVSVDPGFDVVRPFFEEWDIGINYPIVMTNAELEKAYGYPSIYPTTFVVDSDGYIIDRFIGAIPKNRLEPYIQSLTANL